MIANLAVAAVAAIAVALGAVVSRWIRGRGREIEAEAGPGDDPGSRDRGPDGMKM